MQSDYKRPDFGEAADTSGYFSYASLVNSKLLLVVWEGACTSIYHLHTGVPVLMGNLPWKVTEYIGFVDGCHYFVSRKEEPQGLYAVTL